MWLALVPLLLAQVSAPVKVAAPGITCVGVRQDICDAYLDRFATELARQSGLSVLTKSDIAQLLGLERQRQLLGCDESRCLAELTGALGVDAVLAGSILKTEGGYTVTVRAVKATDGTKLAAISQRLADVASLEQWLDDQAPGLARDIERAFGRAPASSSSISPGWVPFGLGLAVLAGGATCFALSKADAASLRSPGLSDDGINAAASRGATLQPLGLVLMGVGAAAVVGGIIWLVLGRDDVPAVALMPLQGGGAFAVGGRF